MSQNDRKPVSESNMFKINPHEYMGEQKANKGTLKQLLGGVKTLLQPFQYDLKTSLREENGILNNVTIEINIKNLK